MRPRTRAALVHAAALPCTLLLGVVAAINPQLALIGVIALAAVGICLPRGELAVASFAGATYFDVIGSSAISPVKMLGGVVVLSGALLLLAPSRRRSAPTWQHHPFVVVCSVALVIWSIASVSWAVDAGQVRMNGTRLATDVLVLLAIPLLVRRVRDLRVIGWSIVAAALAGAGAGRLLGNEFGGRAVGMFADPNEFATATVVGAAFALALGESSGRALPRWVGRVAACLALVAMMMSASRSGIVATVVAVIILVLTARGVERVRLAGLTGVAVAIVTGWLMLSPAGAAVVERIGGENSTGRADLWRVAVYQFQDEPVHGVGLGNYPVVSIEYLRRDVANIDLFIRMPRTVHNTPLELLAELGVVGFLAFYGIVIGCILALRRALKQCRALADEHLVGAIRGTAAGIGALLAASLTLSGLYVELMWILFGVAIACASIVRARRFEAQVSAAELDVELANPALEPAIAPLLTPASRA
jgi:O-antigen ligase